ncbi:MAG: glutamate--cysteine ligase [Epsilonproteobacteria bacterium]|nr:MAG: glutamate--cysteine ligase [Campylobacterota bacterium]RLA67752.1 MAG: glutamate--cysteine ligase [Campylobacterota bacterium]
MEFKKNIRALKGLGGAPLKGLTRGIERETLRADLKGYLSAKQHQKGLGSALTNPYITTDFSESQIEFVTPAFSKSNEALDFLRDLHQFSYDQITDELLWPSSMPCLLDEKQGIPVAKYGSSNLAKFKHVYRLGLKNRYGTYMQAISGIHYNLSFPSELWSLLKKQEEYEGSEKDFISHAYFSLIRNFHRYGWVLLYFFGSSPVLDKSFFTSGGKDHNLDKFDDKGTLFLPHATSLRMSDLGYHNKKQKNLEFCFNSMESYLMGLERAIRTEDVDYKKIGIKKDGEYKQLNTNVLQIENEYYGQIRPKRSPSGDTKRANHLLRDEGVEYVELRIMDSNPFSPIGLNLDQMRFIDAFLTYCLLKESPPCSFKTTQAYKGNWQKVATEGRKDNLRLKNGEKDIGLKLWGLSIYEELKEVAELLDLAEGITEYTDVVEKFRSSLIDSNYTISGYLLNELKLNDQSFFEFSMAKAQEFKNEITKVPMSDLKLSKLKEDAKNSLISQKEIEQSDKTTFNEYLENYIKT